MKRGNNTQKIQEQFTQLMTVEDVVALINLAKSDIFGESCEPITIKQFNYHRYNSLNKKRYSSFSIKKKNGGERIIYAPNSGLKVIQTCLNYIFQLCYSPSNSAYGFVEGRSVVDNARQHIGQNFVFNIDLKDFFPSIEAGRIFKRLQVKPFNLSHEAASAITDICCHKMTVERMNKDGRFVKTTRNVLPQGAPTSPILTNIICEKLDRKLLKLATNFNLKYTRYADDITFSSYYNAFEDTSDFIQNMKSLIAEEGFFINEKKTRLQKHNARQEVTGLVVSNDRVNVLKKYIKDLRGILFCWEKYGEEEVLKRFTPRYMEEKGHIKKGEPDIKNVVSGKLLYLRMVKGADNNTYQNLQARFNKLCGINPNQKLEETLTVWEQQGIDAAMKKYYEKDSDKETVEVFIGTLMDRKPLPRDIKERIIALCAINLQKNLVKEDAAARSSYPEPKQTYEFLSFFSQNDGGLKNLTHDFNYGYIDYDVFMAQCRREFEGGKEKFPKVPSRLLKRIEAFAFEKAPDWFIQKWLKNERQSIKYGWSEPAFIEWYKTNKIHPSKDAFYNKGMIVPFKESIQVRADTGNLVALLNSLITKVFGETPSCNVTISNEVKDAQFYTDVDSLGQALYQIFSTIKEYSEKNFCDEVEIDYFTEGEYKVLTVTHIDSKPTKRADDKDYSGGNTNAIKKQLRGLCNYEICAVFPDGPYRKIILSDNYDVFKKGIIPIDANSIKGYTHKMLFY